MQTSNSTRYSGVVSCETRVGIQITCDRYMFPGMPSDRRHKPQARSGSWCNWWSAFVAGRGQEEDLGADIAIYGVHEALVVAPAGPHVWVRSTHQFLPAQVLTAGAWSGCAVGRFFFALPRDCLGLPLLQQEHRWQLVQGACQLENRSRCTCSDIARGPATRTWTGVDVNYHGCYKEETGDMRAKSRRRGG
jgi:hypothetical protein